MSAMPPAAFCEKHPLWYRLIVLFIITADLYSVYHCISDHADAFPGDLVFASQVAVSGLACLWRNADGIFRHCFWSSACFNMAVLEAAQAVSAEFSGVPAGVFTAV